MKRARWRVVAAALWVLASAQAAAAQNPAGRFTVSGSAGGQAAAPRLHDRFEFEQFIESGTANVAYAPDAGLFADVGVAVRLRRSLAVSVATSYVRGGGSAHVEARIPHPFVFGQHRDVAGDTPELSRSEAGVHMQVRWALPAIRRVQVAVGAGPSVFLVNQDLVDDVRFDQSFPFDTVTFRGVHSRRATGHGAGFNAGADVTWMINGRVGLGALIRYSRGTAGVEASGGREATVDTGGLHAGAGLRLFFR